MPSATPKSRSYLEDPNVKRYAHDLSTVVILDPDTELTLLKKYKETGDLEAKHRLIESGLRFVVTLAKKFSQGVDQHKSLILAGNEGLVIALDKYKLGKGTRFLSYATWWILLYIREELNKTTTVSIPVWREKAKKKVRDLESKYIQKNGHPPKLQDLQDGLPLSSSQIENLLNQDYSEISLEDLKAQIPTCLTTYIQAKVALNEHQQQPHLAEEVLAKKNTQEILQFILSSLPARDKFILEAYFGFITDRPLSLKQIAIVMGVSSEWVRQLKLESLDYVKSMLTYYGVEGLDDLLS